MPFNPPAVLPSLPRNSWPLSNAMLNHWFPLKAGKNKKKQLVSEGSYIGGGGRLTVKPRQFFSNIVAVSTVIQPIPVPFRGQPNQLRVGFKPLKRRISHGCVSFWSRSPGCETGWGSIPVHWGCPSVVSCDHLGTITIITKNDAVFVPSKILSELIDLLGGEEPTTPSTQNSCLEIQHAYRMNAPNDAKWKRYLSTSELDVCIPRLFWWSLKWPSSPVFSYRWGDWNLGLVRSWNRSWGPCSQVKKSNIGRKCFDSNIQEKRFRHVLLLVVVGMLFSRCWGVDFCWHHVFSQFQPKKNQFPPKKTAKFAQKNGVKPRAVHVSHPISNMFKLHSNSCWDPPGKLMLIITWCYSLEV